MHLRYRSAGHGGVIEAGKYFVQRLIESALDAGNGHSRIERRHAVLQPGQFVGNIGGQQVAPGGEHLAELDKNRPQALQGFAQALAAWRVQVAPPAQNTRCATQQGLLKAVEDEFVQAITQHNPDDEDAAKQAPHGAALSAACA
jgi:hypothetical protein